MSCKACFILFSIQSVKPHLKLDSQDRQNIRERAVSVGDGYVSRKRLFNGAFFDGGSAFGHMGVAVFGGL